jgi:hypothetical protein
MRVWHSHDSMWLTAAESQARMAESGGGDAGTNMAASFQDVRATPTQDGFVVQAWIAGLTGAGLAGAGGRTHVVQICTVEDGLIASCEEYIAPEMPLG